MKKIDKELLLKDLCARLPYGVICRLSEPPFGEIIEPLKMGGLRMLIEEKWNVRPYLRQMSSMTEEERKEYYTFQYKFTLQEYDCQELNKETFLEYLDWLNKNHFDYCNLIEKNLAIEVTEENNPYKN